MGQRLVVSIEKNEKAIAKIYYHWSAYTGSALYEVDKIIGCIYNHKDETEKEMLLRLIRFCEENGGGIDGIPSEFEYIKGLYPNEKFKEEGISRNDGLIALSEENMASMQKWSEGDVYINLDTDQVDFCVYSGYESLEEYIEERKSWDDEFDEKKLDNMPEFDFSLGYFDVHDVGAIMASLDEHGIDDGIIKCNGEICELIG